MKFKIFLILFIFLSCSAKMKYHTKSFVDGCFVGSSVFIGMQTKKEIPIQQRFQLRKFCAGLEKGFQAELNYAGSKI